MSAALLAVVAFALWAPSSRWDDPVSLAALAAIAALAYSVGFRLKLSEPAYFDASIALALLALAIGGPIPALVVWAIPDCIARFVVRQDPVASPGHVVTISSFALAILAGAGVLGLSDYTTTASAIPAIYTAGTLMWAVNFFVARAIFAPAYQGLRARDIFRSEFVDMGPAMLGVLALTVAAWALLAPLGVFALVLLAAVILLPELGFRYMGRRRSVRRLGPRRATHVYASAIADELGLSRLERRLLDEATIGPARPLRPARPAQRHRLLGIVELGRTERWDGAGRPFGARGPATLRVSRVLAVAQTWGSLTAAGSAGLSQTEAMLALELRAGAELDPDVVRAAGAVVAAEKAFLHEPDFEPRLHRLPIPRALRRQALPALLGRLAGAP